MRDHGVSEKPRFEKIRGEQKLKNQTSLTVWVALLFIGAVMLLAKLAWGWLFVILGAILAAGYISGLLCYKKTLKAAGGSKSLSAQLESNAARDFSAFRLVFTPEFAVITGPILKVIRLSDMQQFEVGLGDMQKALFLTDVSGTRYKIAEVQAGSGLEKEFDTLYGYVKDLFGQRRLEQP